jgi:hypothetical protein
MKTCFDPVIERILTLVEQQVSAVAAEGSPAIKVLANSHHGMQRLTRQEHHPSGRVWLLALPVGGAVKVVRRERKNPSYQPG